MRKNLLKKPDRLTILLFFLFILFISTIVWTHVADKDTIRPFYYYQLDKVVHFLAGWWVVAVLLAKLRLRRGRTVFLLISVAVLWELFELAFFSDTKRMYGEKYSSWLTDTLVDVSADFLGGIVAFRAFSVKK